ncbi:unnamed protein product [Linum tenue]|uniref:Bidirectional sugar transporter SWEET n=1 Tax=Linum tenue TaxID=586396 RepID=A0AAV0J588_9ROSI|nr:unnamed protein product [Linum tenue]
MFKLIFIGSKTFARIVKMKSTEDYKGVPYIITLLSASLWTFYGLLKPDGLLIVTVNSAGAIFQTIYVILFITYAPKQKKVQLAQLTTFTKFLGGVVAITLLALHKNSHEKITFVGTLCMALTIGMYAAPLSAMRMVIQTKSVMYMPFLLSFCLFLNGSVWSIYAVLVKDIYIIIPNAIGFVLGIAQLAIYFKYKGKSPEPKQGDDEDDDVDTEMGPGFHEMDTLKTDTTNHNMHKVDEEEGNEEEEEEGQGKPQEQRKQEEKGPTMGNLVIPPKPSINRAHSVKKIIRTISSIRPYDLDSNWATTTGAHGPAANKMGDTPRYTKKEDSTTPKPSVNKPQSVRKITRTISSIHPYDASDSNWAAATTAHGPATTTDKLGDTPTDQKKAFNRLQSVKKIMRTISSIHPSDLDSNWAATTPRGKPMDRSTSMIRPAVK